MDCALAYSYNWNHVDELWKLQIFYALHSNSIDDDEFFGCIRLMRYGVIDQIVSNIILRFDILIRYGQGLCFFSRENLIDRIKSQVISWCKFDEFPARVLSRADPNNVWLSL